MDDDGFTLVELLIVIVILGILGVVVMFAVEGSADYGSQSACAAGKRTVQSAVEAYYAEHGDYPADGPATVLEGRYLKAGAGAADWEIDNATGAVSYIGAGDC